MKNNLTINRAILPSFIALLFTGSLSAQNFNIGTLPPGKTIIVTYDVDVNANVCPTGTLGTNISNQSNVTGGNIPTVQTDDPDIVGASNPTQTAISNLTLGNLVYKDLNKNGVFDGADVGIDGVVLRLYTDANANGVLDAGDGAFLTSATTAGGGLYTFTGLCPGDYLVEVAPSNFLSGGPLYDAGLSAALVSSPVGGAPDPDNNTNNDDNGDPVSGFGVASQAITLALGTEPTNDGDSDNNTNLSLDFGFKTPVQVTISDVGPAEGTGGTTTAFNFTVTLDSDGGNFSLNVNTSDGTATTADNDYQAISGGTVSFTAGGPLTQTVTVLVNQDNKVEANETFTVTLSGAPAGVILLDAVGQGTITNDDNATVTLTGGATQNEGTSFTFTATLNNPVQGGFTVPYTTNNGTATSGSDYTDNDNTLSFTGTAGEAKTITVASLQDIIVELNETFTVNLTSISGAPAGVTIVGSPQTGTIANDDQATVTINNVSLSEGNAGTTNFVFTVTLTGEVDAAVNMNYATVDGTATVANNDYGNTSGALTAFSANGGPSQTRTVTVLVNGDNTFEGNETFLLRLSSLSSGGRNVVFSPAGTTLDGTGTIQDDDIPPVIINEADSDTPGTDAAEFVELYDGGIGNLSLAGMVLVFYNGANDQSYFALDLDPYTTSASGYFTAGNAGVPGVDATFAGNLLQNGQDAIALYAGNATDFPNGTPVTTTNLIDALVYDTDDPDDAGLLVLLNAGEPQINENGNGDGSCNSMQRITNGSGGRRNTSSYQEYPPTPDAANFIPTVSIAVSPSSVLENGVNNLVYTVTRNGDLGCSLSVPLTISGTASSGTDYTAITTTAVIAAGSTSVTISVDPTDDNIVEPNETIIITLVDGATYDLGVNSSATGTITNDDAATVTLSGGATQNEGTAFVFTATLNNPVQGGFTVPYTTNDGTAVSTSDYTDNDNTLTFAGTAGEAKTITVNTGSDNLVELDETFTVNLTSINGAPAGVTIVGSPQTGTIANDDAATVSIAGNVSGPEATTPQNFSVTLTNPVDVNVTVSFSTSDGTATVADNDYTGIAGQTVTFLAGSTTSQTVPVAISNDNKVEANEVYNVSIGTLNASGRNVALGTSTGTGTINNDDSATVLLEGPTPKNEGNTGTTSYAFNATLDNPVQGGFTVNYTTNDGTATTADNDYVDNDGALIFTGTGGEIKTITVLVNGDYKVEAQEIFQVALNAITGAPAGVTIAGSPKTGTINNDEVDWGDGPDTLPTRLAMNGARHNTILGFQLGAAIDGDPDGQPSGGAPYNDPATGDDNDAEGDDEDGVTLPSVFVTGTTATVTVNASAAGKLDAWMDFNWNRNLGDSGEKIFNNVALSAGDNVLTFAVPSGATVGSTFLRFRFSSAGGLAPSGLASDGEVEDYRAQIVNNQFSINDPSVTEGNAGTSNLVFTVSRTSNATASSVDYAITGGTATSGTDYVVLAAGTVNFPISGALTQNVTVTVNGDLIIEDNETVNMTLSNPVNGGILDGSGTGTITNDDSGTLTLSGGTAQNEGNSGTVSYTFTATLSAAVQGGFTANYTTNNGTATVGDNDYQDNDGTLSFVGTAGETKTFTVLVNGDIKVELNETFTGNLNSISGTTAVQNAAITLAGSPQTSTITNDDAAIVSIAANVSGAENVTPQPFSITLSNPVDVPVSILFSTADGTATTADNDYTGIASQIVTFPAGSTTTQTVPVTIVNDNKVEANETYNVSIGTLNATGRNVSLGTSTGTGTITNDDNSVVTLSGGTSKNEGNSGTTAYVFTATLSNPVQGGLTANYTTNDGTATTANNDYQDNDGALVFTGTASEAQTFTVLVNGDLNIENDETFTTAINSLTGVVNPGAVTIAGSPQTSTIVNDEQDWGDAPTAAQSGFAGTYPTLSADNGARHLLAPGGLRLGATVDADLDGQPNANATGDGADEDGVTLPGALVINTTANITVNASGTGKLNAWADFNRDGDWNDAGEKIFNDASVVAGNNSLSFAVPNASLGLTYLRFRLTTATGTAVDGSASDGEVEDYQVNVVNTQFNINDPVVTEGNAGTTNLAFVISRTVNATACSIDYAITGGTATVADGDYQTLAAGTVNFTANGAFSQTVNVVVNGDVKVELNETVDMTLSNPVNGAIQDGSGTGTITNDDAATITVGNVAVTEGDGGTTNATFTINMSNPVDANVTLNYATVDGTATLANSDYVNTNGAHTFTPGQQSKTVTVPVIGDCAIEANETYLLRLSALGANGRNVSLSGGGATLDGTGTINNDDALPVITCPTTLLKLEATAGLCSATTTLTLPTLSSICGSSVLEFHYRTVDNNNNPTGAYNAFIPSANNTVTFPVGRYELEWRVTDGSGSAVCSFIVLVNDSQPPSIVCPANQNIPANANCQGILGSWSPTSVSDNCTPANTIVVTQTPAANTPLSGHNASVVVTLTATDQYNNNASCTFTVTLKDQTPPVAKCKNATVNIGANGSVIVSGAVIDNGSTDNCSGLTFTVTPNIFNCSNITTNNIVTLRATDAGGNSATCTAKITVKDATGPNAICANPTIFLDNTGHATLSVNQVDNGSTDNCGILSKFISKTSFNCSEISGTNPVTLTLNDVNGNTSTCTSNVTVKDAVAPTPICEDVSVHLGPNGYVTVYGSDLAFESTDNCSVTSYSPIAKVYTAANLGNNNLTVTVKDFSNNAATCVSVVTVLPQFNSDPNNRTNPGDFAEPFIFVLYPNPADARVMAAFEMKEEQEFRLRMFDLAGRLVLEREEQGAKGENTIAIELGGVAAGVYIVDFETEGVKLQKRLVVQN